MRLLAIGDIHGYRDKLERLMDQVRPTDADQVVFLGDYVDRGPDSKGVIDFLIEFGRRFPQTVFLQGNHEQMMLDYLHEQEPLPGWTPLRERSLLYAWENRRDGPGIWLYNGGDTCLKSYGGRRPPQEHLDFLLATRLFFTWERFVFVHADAQPNVPLEDQDAFDLQWSRSPEPMRAYFTGKVLVTGHTPRNAPDFGEFRVDLDTGSGRGPSSPLTCADLLTGHIWRASAAPESEDPPPWHSTGDDPPEESQSVLLSDGKAEIDGWYHRGFHIDGRPADLAVYTRWRRKTRW